jgi:medium-chain acyl-[acyl-carrier-protein] hydrolase
MPTPSHWDAPTGKWLEFVKPRPRAGIRLLCFPYAGGSALAFRDWQDALPDFIEVWPIQLPARGRRISEPPFTRVGDVVDAVEKALFGYLDKPYAIFGYSMGALIAFELARRAEACPVLSPSHLFVGARGAPHLRSRMGPTHKLPDPQFLLELRRFQATPDEILDDPELIQFFLPTLRADFEVAMAYEFLEGPPLRCPISAFGGLEDPDVPTEDLEPWQLHTAAHGSLQLFPGGHFFLNARRADLLSAISRDLIRLVSSEPNRRGLGQAVR